MLKASSILFIAVLVFIANSNSQNRISKRAIPENLVMESFNEINKFNELWLKKFDGKEFTLREINTNNMMKALTNPQSDFPLKDNRTALNKLQLGDGFLLLERISQYWTSSDWTNGFKISYTYDGNNSKNKELWQPWDGSDWVNYSTNWGDAKKYSFSYDGNNNLIEYTQQTGGGILGGRWVNANKQISTYDGNNNLIEFVLQIGKDDTSWVNTDRQISTYDGNNNLIEFIMQTWGQQQLGEYF